MHPIAQFEGYANCNTGIRLQVFESPFGAAAGGARELLWAAGV